MAFLLFSVPVCSHASGGSYKHGSINKELRKIKAALCNIGGQLINQVKGNNAEMLYTRVEKIFNHIDRLLKVLALLLLYKSYGLIMTLDFWCSLIISCIYLKVFELMRWIILDKLGEAEEK